MNVQIIKGYQQEEGLRRSFNELTQKTFGLNFEPWYQHGYWGEQYIPYSVVTEGKVAANASVSIMDFECENQIKHYIQIGTVMTEEGYRNQGFSRLLMDEILKDYTSCDGIYLYANDSVLDFYPKFGFRKEKEYRYFKEIKQDGTMSAHPVSMKSADDWEHFLREKEKRNSRGIVKMHNNGLLMFYLTQFMQESVYYVKDADAYVIAEIEEDTLLLYDIFAHRTIALDLIWKAFGGKIRKAVFQFVPQDTTGLTRFQADEEDSTFFIRGNITEDMKKLESLPKLAQA